MALTSIGQQKTPARPTEITFAADTGLPSDLQIVLLAGHANAGATGTNTVVTINNVADAALAKTEAELKFGVGSELAKMVVAAVKANAGGSTFPALKACVLASTDTGFDADAQDAIQRTRAEFLVTPYDLHVATTNRNTLKAMAIAMSGAQRVSNNQFGTVGWGFNRTVSDPSLLFKFDTQFMLGAWLYDSGSPAYTIAEMAAATAARAAAGGVPFNPMDDVTIENVDAPALVGDWPTVGAGLESESALNQGWAPLWVKPNGEVAFVRTVTGRLSADGTGTPVVTSYYDLQDFQVLYYFRKAIYTRFSQPDFKQVKASDAVGLNIKAEAIRLATEFENQGMFQAVSQLAKKFQVQRNASDRSRFDLLVPVNVVPGLHVIATNIEATTEFDTITL